MRAVRVRTASGPRTLPVERVVSVAEPSQRRAGDKRFFCRRQHPLRQRSLVLLSLALRKILTEIVFF